MNFDFENNEVFKAHGCRVHNGALRLKDFGNLDDCLIKSKIPNFPIYFSPPKFLKSHVIWGGGYAHEFTMLGPKPIQQHIVDLFRDAKMPVILATFSLSGGLVVLANKFSDRLVCEFQEWAGFTQEVLIIDESRNIVFARNDELEYSIYSRDVSRKSEPFPGFSDDELVEKFFGEEAAFRSSIIDATRIPHFLTELLPKIEGYKERSLSIL